MKSIAAALCVLTVLVSTAMADHHMHNQWLEYSGGEWEVETFVWEDGEWTVGAKHTSVSRPVLNGNGSVSEQTWDDGRKSLTMTGWIASKATLITSISENGATFTAVFKESDSTSEQRKGQIHGTMPPGDNPNSGKSWEGTVTTTKTNESEFQSITDLKFEDGSTMRVKWVNRRKS